MCNPREMREERGEWREVQGRQKKHNTNSETYNPDNITTFYITKFPDDVNAHDLLTSFAQFWRVAEVYIPAKKDRLGKRFGFARFLDVVDDLSLLEMIEETWFGSFKIRANISKFKKGDVPALEGNLAKPKYDLPGIRQGPKEGENVVSSFKQTLVEGGQNLKLVFVDEVKLPTLCPPASQEVIELEVVPDNLQKLNDNFVGFLRDEVDFNKLHMLLAMEGLQNIQVAPLGVDVVLLSSTIHEGVKKALQTNSGWWDRWFQDIRGWNPNLVPPGRRLWVRIFGIPPQAWGFDCFRKITLPFGKLIKLDS
ncbi:hypothetical protein P8452_44114 [Trifolium repens]|jgi:RNA recognition motif-containing protein|nr:zinc finger CCCH domain-containing protein [Trifolium repens]WJX58685.1 hypothetical protein P8452_44114 [Trifolium repens]